MQIENEYQRLSALVRDSLQGAKLVDWQCIEQDASENAYITLAMREGGRYTRKEYVTHRAVLRERGGMLGWGNYFFNVMDATMDYNLRVNGTGHVS